MWSYKTNCEMCDADITASSQARYIGGDYGDPVIRNSEKEMETAGVLCISCETAWRAETGTCCRCGNNAIPLPDLNWMDDDIVCSTCAERCYFYCEACDRRHDKRHVDYYTTRGGSTICEDCYCEDYFTCDDCGAVCHVDYRHGDYCDQCYEHNDGDSLIHDYSYKPRPNFIGKGKLFFGCELEVTVNDRYSVIEKAEEVFDILNPNGSDHAYLKSDSSIGRGFEIVTHPHSYEEIRKLWLEKWKENIQGITSHNSGTCGFHVHVSRGALSKMHIQKLIVFINAPENASMVRSVAQRNCDNWGIIKSNKVIGHCGHSDDRYEAINLLNKHTIEFRIFRGNVRKDRIMKNLEFVKATIDFTRDRSYRDLSGDKFRAFVSGRRKEFKYLHEFLQLPSATNNNNSDNI